MIHLIPVVPGGIMWGGGRDREVDLPKGGGVCVCGEDPWEV